ERNGYRSYIVRRISRSVSNWDNSCPRETAQAHTATSPRTCHATASYGNGRAGMQRVAAQWGVINLSVQSQSTPISRYTILGQVADTRESSRNGSYSASIRSSCIVPNVYYRESSVCAQGYKGRGYQYGNILHHHGYLHFCFFD